MIYNGLQLTLTKFNKYTNNPGTKQVQLVKSIISYNHSSPTFATATTGLAPFCWPFLVIQQVVYPEHNPNDNGQKENKDINKIIHTTKYAPESQSFFTPNGLRSRAVFTSPTSDEPSAKKN
jgi:hypothetical protein